MTLKPEERRVLESLLKTRPDKPREDNKDEKPHEKEKVEETKPSKVKGIRTAKYEIITIKDGCNLHVFKELPASDKTYERERFLIPRNIVDKLKKRVRFVVVQKSSEKKEDKPIALMLTDPVEVNSRLLYTVHSSRTLKKALLSLFRTPFNLGGFGGKKIVFVIVIIAVAVVGYLIYSGQLNLGGLIKT